MTNASERVKQWRDKNGRPYEYNANALARYRRWRAKNKQKASEIARRSKLKARFGLTEEQYEVLLENQGFACAICNEPFADTSKRRLHVDHNHTTGTVRGLLCAKCNHGLGNFRDNQELLFKAAAYLQFFDATKSTN